MGEKQAIAYKNALEQRLICGILNLKISKCSAGQVNQEPFFHAFLYVILKKMKEENINN